MTKLQTVVSLALVAVLSVIAWELDSIRRALPGGSTFNAAASSFVTPRIETREDRNRRLQREQQQYELDSEAIWKTPDPHKRPIK